LPFFGVMKILGTAAILIPAFSQFKEAAYAGLIFYFIGAVYCHIAVGDGADKFGAPLFILIAIIVSYIFSNKLSDHS
ncbi:MAG: DoxX family protein, partial [Bacteroidota bacterium]